MADCIAGSISLISVQAEYFSTERLDLIHAYAEMLVLLFEQDEFYTSKQIEMVVMPAYPTQRPILASFQQRVKQRILDATRKQELLPRLQAEMEVWQELEYTMLHLSSVPEANLQDI